MAQQSLDCFQCGRILKFSDRIGLREECLDCRADVHVCRNCDFYDPKAYNECREPSADVVREKERSNPCDYFKVRSQKAGGVSQADSLRAAAEALFKKN